MDPCEEADANWMNQQSSKSSSFLAAVEKDISREIDALNLEENSRMMMSPAIGDADFDSGKEVLYPIRPSQPDCAFYLRTGCCKFGSFCRFNHPRDKRVGQIIKERDKGFPKVFDRCKFYLLPGGCRFGESCKYRHSHEIPESVPVELNDLGLPIRKGERVCLHYMRTGICKYSSSCKFHHPELSGVAGLHVYACHSPSFIQSTMRSSHLSATSQTLQAASNDSGSNLDILQPSMTATFLDSILPSLSRRTNCYPSAVDQNGFSKLEDSSMQQKEVIDNQKEPGESQSRNGIRYEGFKLGLPWWPIHSKDHFLESEGCLLSPIGLPQRPDHPVCIYYSRFGICKYGPACKFDHPVDENTDQSIITGSLEEKREDDAPLTL